jgi:hypothetical protein
VAEVAIGTNTSTSASSITYAAGRAWAQMVNSFASWLGTVLYGSQVIAAGGNDIETSWAAPSVARSWVDGYASAYTRRLLNTGSVDGCSWTGIPGSECNGSWLPEDVYHVSWGSPPAWAVPEIYRTDGRQAQQWYWMARYAVQAHGLDDVVRRLVHAAPRVRDRLLGLNNTVAAGYTQLYNALAQNVGDGADTGRLRPTSPAIPVTATARPDDEDGLTMARARSTNLHTRRPGRPGWFSSALP